MRMFYFDCAASAPVLPYIRHMRLPAANPNSVHAAGRDARERLETARETIARIIGAEPCEIAFTPSASAACAIALHCAKVGSASLHEHNAVFDNVEYSEGMTGIAHILVNNETGEDYTDTVKRLAAKNDVFTDATAAMGHIPVDVQLLGVKALAAGGHKFGALPGIGFIYVRGGISDDDTFPGTPPVMLADGMATALKYRVDRMPLELPRMQSFRETLAAELLRIPGAHINAEGKPNAGYILSVRFDGVDNKQLLTLLDYAGVYASAGSACNADDPKPSRVLMADGLTAKEASETIRLSWCPETAGFSEAATIIAQCVDKARALNV